MKKTWTVKSGEEIHTVEYRRSLFGIVSVAIDGDSFKLGFVSCFAKRNEPFRVGDTQCMLCIAGRKTTIVSNECEIALAK